MGVSIGVVEWLRRAGYDAIHLREEGWQRMPNGDIFLKAVAEGRVLLTFDLDFGEIAALSAGKKPSVVIFRLHNTRTPHVMDRLAAVLDDCKGALNRSAVVVVEEARHRVRYLPVGRTTDS